MDCFPSVFEYYFLQFYTYKQYTCTFFAILTVIVSLLFLQNKIWNLSIVSNIKIPQMLLAQLTAYSTAHFIILSYSHHDPNPSKKHPSLDSADMGVGLVHLAGSRH